MQCPTCQQEMALQHKDTSRSRRQDQSFDRAIYTCSSDNTWVTVETPQSPDVLKTTRLLTLANK